MNWLNQKLQEAENSFKDLLSFPHSQKITESSVGITDQLKEFVQNLCEEHPDTFVNFPLEEKEIQEKLVLTTWQEKHVKLMLESVEDLRLLRFHLCPSQLKDDEFWTIYFLLVRNKVGPISSESSENTPIKKENEQARSVSPVMLDLVGNGSPFSSPISKGSDIEQYFDEIWKEDILNNSNRSDEGIQPDLDNYYSASEINTSMDFLQNEQLILELRSISTTKTILEAKQSVSFDSPSKESPAASSASTDGGVPCE